MQSTNLTPAGRLNQNRLNARESAILDRAAVRKATVLWDFSVDGGAVGTFDLGVDLPAGAIVTSVVCDALTAATSGGSMTAQLKAGATALTDATAKASLTGVATQALASSATAIKPSDTATSRLSLALATAAATAGKLMYTVTYVVSRN